MSDITGNKEGFTLIELAIVIVAIAFIVATVTAGNGIIHQFKLRSLTADLYKYKTMISVFKTEYNALPGDMKNASSYWTGAINGNGDNLINTFSESYLAWQHLYNAGLIIKVPYNGTLAGSLPSSALSQKTSYFIFNLPSVAVSQLYLESGSKLAIHIVDSSLPTANWTFLTPRIKTTDAYYIDSKIDDGLASRGKLVGWAPASGWFCALQSNLGIAPTWYTGVAKYDLTRNGKCILTYYM